MSNATATNLVGAFAPMDASDRPAHGLVCKTVETAQALADAFTKHLQEMHPECGYVYWVGQAEKDDWDAIIWTHPE